MHLFPYNYHFTFLPHQMESHAQSQKIGASNAPTAHPQTGRASNDPTAHPQTGRASNDPSAYPQNASNHPQAVSYDRQQKINLWEVAQVMRIRENLFVRVCDNNKGKTWLETKKQDESSWSVVHTIDPSYLA